MTDLPFVREVLMLFDRADCHGELFWRVNGEDIRLFALVNDVFAWGCADLEEITPDTLPALLETYASLSVVGSTEYLPDLYAARRRQMRPQNAAMPTEPRVRALFEACGPERPIDLGNPKDAKGADYVQTWESYWKDRLVRSDGSLDLAQVMKELHDYQALKAAFLERLESEIAAVRAGIIKGIRHYFAPADSYDGVDLDDDVRILCGRIERGEY